MCAHVKDTVDMPVSHYGGHVVQNSPLIFKIGNLLLERVHLSLGLSLSMCVCVIGQYLIKKERGIFQLN